MQKMETLKLNEAQVDVGCSKSVKPTKEHLSSAIVGFHRRNRKTILQGKLVICDSISPKQKSFKMSEVDSTSKGKVLKPYWDDFSKEISSQLWLPTKTALLDLEPISLNILSQQMAENSWFSIKVNSAHNKSLPKICLPYSLFSHAGCMDSDVIISKSKKIRIYPTAKQKVLFSQWFGTSRYVYNNAVSYLKKPDTKASWMSIKTGIIHDLPEWSKTIPYQIKSIAIKDCCSAVKNAKNKFKLSGKFQDVKFRTRRDTQQSCFIPKSSISELGIYHTLSKELKWTESIPEECLDARLVKNNGRYFVTIPYKMTIQISENQGKVVALDPGIRTFMTFYSEQSCGKIGYGDFKRIFRLCRVMDKLQSILSDKTLSFYRRSRLKKSLGKLRWKVKDLISELHHKAALFFVKNFDVIFLPTFEVSDMVDRIKRKITSKSARQMLTLCHFRFKEFIKAKAFEYNKTVVDVCEAYTSKTVSWTGEIVSNLGGSKTIRSEIDKQTMDRDINGARGIFLRALGDSPIFRDYLKDKLVLNSF